MKIYTNTFDLARPVPKKFWVAPHSEFAIGIKVVRDGQPVEDFTLQADGQTLTADIDKIAGFAIYNTSSGSTGFVEYTVACGGQTFTLTQIVTDSTVFEIGRSPKTEYVVVVGSIDQSGTLTRQSLSSVLSVADYALKGAFTGNTDIVNVNMGNVTDIGEEGMKGTFSGCTSLKSVDFSKLSAVGTDGLDGTFNGCSALEIVLFQNSAAVPAITETTFASTNDSYVIIVPDALYENWISAENWTGISSHVTQVSAYAAVMTPYGGQDNMDDNG